jgi:hypothetical protein
MRPGRKWYDEFVSEGGRVYFNRVEDIGLIKKRIESTFKLAAAKAGQGGPQLQVKRALIAVRDAVENLNLGVENAVRLSTYRAAREAGASKPQAASIAKNITVNFNRRGTFGPAMNALYLFYNAGMQGSVRLLQATRSPKVRKMLAGIAVTGMMVELLNAMLSGTDDDGEKYYDKIPAYEKSRNLILMLPGGSQYLKIPTPYGYNVFWELGRSIGEIGRRGGERWQETGANWLTTALSSFNPIGGADSLLNLIAPTVGRPDRRPRAQPRFHRAADHAQCEPLRAARARQPALLEQRRHRTGRRSPTSSTTSTGGSASRAGRGRYQPRDARVPDGPDDRLGRRHARSHRLDSEQGGQGRPRRQRRPDCAQAHRHQAVMVRQGGEFYDRLGEVEQQIHYAKGYLEQGNRAEAQRFVQDHQRVVSLDAGRQARAQRDARRAQGAPRARLGQGKGPDRRRDLPRQEAAGRPGRAHRRAPVQHPLERDCLQWRVSACRIATGAQGDAVVTAAFMWAFTFGLAAGVALPFYGLFRWANRPRTTPREALVYALSIFLVVATAGSLVNLAALHTDTSRGEIGGPEGPTG